MKVVLSTQINESISQVNEKIAFKDRSVKKYNLKVKIFKLIWFLVKLA